MTTPEPSWARPATPPAAVEAALHLRFAITPTGPSLQHIAGGAEAVTGPQPQSAWHELTVAALLVCLMAEEAAFAVATAPRLVPPLPAELAWPLQPNPGRPPPEMQDPMPAARFGMPMDDDWMKLLDARPPWDTAWPLA